MRIPKFHSVIGDLDSCRFCSQFSNFDREWSALIHIDCRFLKVVTGTWVTDIQGLFGESPSSFRFLEAHTGVQGGTPLSLWPSSVESGVCACLECPPPSQVRASGIPARACACKCWWCAPPSPFMRGRPSTFLLGRSRSSTSRLEEMRVRSCL